MEKNKKENQVLRCVICNKEPKNNIPPSFRPFYVGCSGCINTSVDYSLLKQWRDIEMSIDKEVKQAPNWRKVLVTKVCVTCKFFDMDMEDCTKYPQIKFYDNIDGSLASFYICDDWMIGRDCL